MRAHVFEQQPDVRLLLRRPEAGDHGAGAGLVNHPEAPCHLWIVEASPRFLDLLAVKVRRREELAEVAVCRGAGIVPIEVVVIQHRSGYAGGQAVGPGGKEGILGLEHDQLPARQVTLAIAAPGGLNDRVQRPHSAQHQRKVQVHACLDHLG